MNVLFFERLTTNTDTEKGTALARNLLCQLPLTALATQDNLIRNQIVDLVHPMDQYLHMSTVTIHEAKTHFSKLVDRAHAGEEIIVAKGNKPWARLVPLSQPEPRRPGLYHGTIPAAVALAPLSDTELVEWQQ